MALLGYLGDLVLLGLLRSVRVLGAGVDLELLDQLAAQPVLGEHAPDGQLDGASRVTVEQLAVADGPEATGASRVRVRELVGPLVPGERDLLRVDDDHEVAAVHVRCERRFVLAAQQGGGGDSEPS